MPNATRSSFVELTGTKSGVTFRAPLRFSFTVPPSGGYLRFTYDSGSSFTMSIYNESGSRELHETYHATSAITNLAGLSNYPEEYWAGGTYSVEIIFGAINKTYSLSIGAIIP